MNIGAIDLGGTFTKVGIFDKEENLLESFEIKSQKPIERFLLSLIKDLKQNYGIKGISIAVAGQIDIKRGYIYFLPNFNEKDIHLKDIIEKELSIKALIINDLKAITFGEYKKGAGRGYKDIFCVFIGTGVGGGAIFDGKMPLGCEGNIGEIGHIKVELNGRACTCGSFGCLESYVGGWAIKKALKDLNLDIKSFKEIKNLEKAKPILEDFVNYLSLGISSIINAFNPCVLILGGGTFFDLEFLFDEIKHKSLELCLPSNRKTEIKKSELKSLAGVFGSFLYFKETSL